MKKQASYIVFVEYMLLCSAKTSKPQHKLETSSDKISPNQSKNRNKNENKKYRNDMFK